jgi:hypothetical protein
VFLGFVFRGGPSNVSREPNRDPILERLERISIAIECEQLV